MVRRAALTRSAVLLGGWFVVVATVSTAHALEDYADAIADELDLRDKPSCLFCHTRNERGLATDTPFNDALKARGFSRRLGEASLRTALRALESNQIDTDGDGVIDVDELSAGANPNDAADKGLPPNACSVSTGHPTSSALWLFGALSLWLTARVRLRASTA